MRFSDKQGFTLIELMISIAIIGILSAVTVSGLAQQKNISQARRLAEKIMNDVQASQNKALSGQTFNGSRPSGFGVTFSTSPGTSYTNFADTCSPSPCTGSNPGNGTYDGASELVRTQTLDTGLTIANLLISGLNSSGQPLAATPTSLTILYSVPNATISASASPAAGVTTIQQATVTIKNSRLNICYAVNINTASGIVSNRSLATCP